MCTVRAGELIPYTDADTGCERCVIVCEGDTAAACDASGHGMPGVRAVLAGDYALQCNILSGSHSRDVHVITGRPTDQDIAVQRIPSMFAARAGGIVNDLDLSGQPGSTGPSR